MLIHVVTDSAKGQMTYQYERADFLERYVRKRYFRNLSSKACHLYGAMTWLEREKGKQPSDPLCVNYRDLADAANIDIKSVRPALDGLFEAGLIWREIGDPDKAKKTATTIRRIPLEDIKSHATVGDDHCDRLAQALNAAGPYEFNGEIVTTTWSPGKTGRVYSSKPFNFQLVKGKHPVRFAGLKSGLKEGQVLAYADICQADPTVIKLLLEISRDRDLYQEYMFATGADRATAKEAVNMLAYCRNSMAVLKHWPEAAQSAMHDYAVKLDDYKAALLSKARHQKGVTTMTGRFIPVQKRERMHPGDPFSWRVQGTIADVINPACLRVLETASLVLTVHDAIYAILPTDKADLVSEVIVEEAHKIGLTVKVEKDEHYANDR